jgi:hypothetical protein
MVEAERREVFLFRKPGFIVGEAKAEVNHEEKRKAIRKQKEKVAGRIP